MKREIAERERRLAQYGARIAQLEQTLSSDGRLLKKADAQAVRADCAAYQEMRVELTELKARCGALETEAQEKERFIATSGYAGMNAEDAGDEALRRVRLYEGASDVKPLNKRMYRTGYILLTVFLAACAAVVVLMRGVLPWYPLAFAFGLASLAALALLYLSSVDRARKRAEAEAQMEQILKAAGVTSPEALRARADEYALALSTLDDVKNQSEQSKQALAEMVTNAKALTARLMEGLLLFGADTNDIQSALRRIDECEAAIDELASLQAAVQSEEQFLTRLKDMKSPEKSDSPRKSAVVPRFSRDETEELLARQSAQVSEMEKRLAAAEGEARAIGDPVVIGAEITKLTSEREEQLLQYEALGAAIEDLEGANTELRTRFSPELSSRASQIVSELTGGRYKGLYFDREWRAQARTLDDVTAHDALYLSAGTSDQIYLALRLAICEMLLSGGDPCPIILDDALTNFDDRRMADALTWLKTAAQTRQIILMTCHSREADFFSGDKQVNLASL